MLFLVAAITVATIADFFHKHFNPSNYTIISNLILKENIIFNSIQNLSLLESFSMYMTFLQEPVKNVVPRFVGLV